MRRLAAIGSLGFALGATVLAVVLAVERIPRGIALLTCLVVALMAGWIALRNEGGPPGARGRAGGRRAGGDGGAER